MQTTVLCPNCKSNEVHFRAGSWFCYSCENLFQSIEKDSDSDEILLSTKTSDPLSVFISYAHAQTEIVTQVMKAIGLDGRGHHVWFDEKKIKPGAEWREKITEGIIKSNGVLSFLSTEAIRDKGVCIDELQIALGVQYGNIRTVLLHKEEVLQPIPMQLTHRQWLDMSDWIERSKEQPQIYKKWVDHQVATILRMIESNDSREFTGDISNIRKKLGIVDTAISRQSWYLKQPFIGRKWLSEKINHWLDSISTSQTCVVYGGPGTGKSAFAAHYAYHNYRVVASIFFEHGNDYFNSPEAVLSELVFQLACRLPSYRHLLINALKGPNFEKLNTQELIERLVSCQLQKVPDGKLENLVILIDGLDECDPDQQKQIINILNSIQFPNWLSTVVFARPEATIEGTLIVNKEIRLDPETV